MELHDVINYAITAFAALGGVVGLSTLADKAQMVLKTEFDQSDYLSEVVEGRILQGAAVVAGFLRLLARFSLLRNQR